MKTNTKLLIAVGVIAALVIIAASIFALAKWREPLAPGLSLPQEMGNGEATGSAVNPETTSPAETICGGPPSMLILAIGTDSRRNDYLYGLADVIRIIRADFVNPKLSVLSLPRDLWVEVPGIQEHGITHGKLSQAYFWGTEGMGYYAGPAFGSGLLALTLEKNLGLQVDHYLTLNMRTFGRIVDAVGGIYIYVPADLDGRYQPVTPSGQALPELEKTPENGFFKAGNYLLDGNLALVYARIRSSDNDFRRQERQIQLLKALRDRLLSPEVVTAVPDLIQAFHASVLTDLSPAQISQLTCLGLRLSEEDIHFTVLPEDLFQSGFNQEGIWILQADFAGLRRSISEFVQTGDWPDQPE